MQRFLRDYRTLPDAIADSARIMARLRHFKLAVFLDYDGTLTPIAHHPEEARLSEAMRQTIFALSQVAVVGIVSGRDKANIQELVNLPNLYYAGNHGFDIEGPRGSGIHHEVGRECLHAMEKCFREMQAHLMPISGVQFEPKKLTVTIHYHRVEERDQPLMLALMGEIVEKYPQLQLTPGKAVRELRPNVEWNKGQAVLWLLEQLRLNQPDVYTIYMGDDQSDEDAFRLLPEQGLSILVGNHEKETYADYHLQDPEQVKIFLRAILLK